MKKPSKYTELLGFDLRSMALFRIGLAFVVIVDLAIRFGDIDRFYSDRGVLPRAAILDGILDPWYWSIHLVNGEPLVQQIIFLVSIACSIAMLVGYRTRLASIAVWALVISVHNRFPALMFAADDVLRALLFWAMFLPLGAAYSIDSALNSNPKPPPKQLLSGATIAMTLQICYVYMFSVIYKVSSPDWSSTGEAVYYAFSFDQYATPISQFFLDFPVLLKLASFATLALEGVGPLFLFVPIHTAAFRVGTVITFILLHISFGLCFELGIFPMLSSFSWLIFLPTAFWMYWEKKTTTIRRSGLQIYYDADCGFCKKIVYLLRTFLVLPKTTITPAQSIPDICADMEKYNSWVVADWKGNRYFKWDAMAYVVSLSPILGWLAVVLRWKPFMVLGTRFYETISNNRKTAGFLTKPLQFRPVVVESIRWKNVLTLGLMAFTTIWIGKDLARRTLPREHFINRQYTRRTAQVLDKFARVTRLNQSWTIFAPGPPRDDGWHVIRGVLEDGTVVDLLRGTEGEPNFEKPSIEQRNTQYPNMQWRTYFINLNRAIGQKLYPHYAEYLCHQWNSTHDRKLKNLDIFFMDERTIPPGDVQSIEKKLHWEKPCSFD
ncbi:MAG: DUF393 domain-containing protein [Cyanobacteria bacterium SID2]|nr:DUF393 domain-containing protein [Cyanobacteria bacterium SID2]